MNAILFILRQAPGKPAKVLLAYFFIFISQPSPAQSIPEDAAQWPMAAKDYASTRYSDLNQVTVSNASQLKVAWTFSTGINRGQEAAPLVVSNRMFVVLSR